MAYSDSRNHMNIRGLTEWLIRVTSRHLSFIVVMILASSIVLRLGVFVAHHGGVEYDSGWFLSVARTLAQHGVYATTVNPLLTEQTISPSLWGRIGVQDTRGLVYFPAANSVGLGYTMPTALILKLWGSGYWQYRAWPMITFSALIILLLSIARKHGGIVAAVALAVMLWAYPQLSIHFFFEAFSEQIATLFLLLSAVLIARESERTRAIIGGGLSVGIACSTKTIFLLFVPATIGLLFFTLRRDSWRTRLKLSAFFCTMAIVPYILMQMYTTVYMRQTFGVRAHEAVQRDAMLHMQGNGSGISVLRDMIADAPTRMKTIESVRRTMTTRIPVWREIFGVRPNTAYWIFFIIMPPIVFLAIRRRSTILIFLTTAPLIPWLWFLIFADSAWGRYMYPSILFAFTASAIAMNQVMKSVRTERSLAMGALMVGIVIMFLRFLMGDRAYMRPDLSQRWMNEQHVISSARPVFGFPALYLFDLAPQQDAVVYITRHTQADDRIVVFGDYLAPELSALPGRVTVVMERFLAGYETRYKQQNNFLVLGPHLVGTFKRPGTETRVQEAREDYCSDTLLLNDGYLVCKLSDKKIRARIAKAVGE